VGLQEYLTSHLSNNLVFLFGRKEKQIRMYKRLRQEEKDILVSAVFRVKESAGRAFLRKAVFLQRSAELCAQLGDLLSKVWLDNRAALLERTSLEDDRIPISDTVTDILGTMKEDLKTQKQLDQGLRNCILGACIDARFPGSESERILMRRFVQFVDSRLGYLEACYKKIEERVEDMGSIVRV